MIKTITKYGKFIHGQVVYRDGVPIRYDKYISNDGVQELVRVIAAKTNDVSCVHDHSTLPGGGYDSKCSCCYLNITHSVDCHNKKLERANND